MPGLYHCSKRLPRSFLPSKLLHDARRFAPRGRRKHRLAGSFQKCVIDRRGAATARYLRWGSLADGYFCTAVSVLIPIITLLLVISLSLIVTRIAAVALALTGLSSEVARFQARSAFSGVGFATAESEDVVRHPVRRRIISLLMLCGNAGIVAAMAAMVATLLQATQSTHAFVLELIFLFAGLAAIWVLSASKTVDRTMQRIIEWALKKFTRLNVRDYEALLRLSDNYTVAEKLLSDDHWAVEKTLADLRLNHDGLLVLGITRKDGSYVGAPVGSTRILAHDTLIVYGADSAIANFDKRPASLDAHMSALTRRLRLLQPPPAPPPAPSSAPSSASPSDASSTPSAAVGAAVSAAEQIE